ncbi:MAG: HepT-like ribonuclease domain-containing protein [Pseudonocardia sp.]
MWRATSGSSVPRGPELFDECARAERYARALRADPRVACIYARRALERLVASVHDVAGLPAPYRNDPDAKLSAPDFRNLTELLAGPELRDAARFRNLIVHGYAQVDDERVVEILKTRLDDLDRFRVALAAAARD